MKATPNGTSTMWKPRVNAIISRAGSSCGGSPAAAGIPGTTARIHLMRAILPHPAHAAGGRAPSRGTTRVYGDAASHRAKGQAYAGSGRRVRTTSAPSPLSAASIPA